MRTEAQKAARNAYRSKCKRFTIDFYNTDIGLIEWLEKQENKSGYIKELIRKDMEAHKNAPIV